MLSFINGAKCSSSMYRKKLSVKDVLDAVNAMVSDDDELSEMSDEDDGWDDATLKTQLREELTRFTMIMMMKTIM